jgi:Coenzyme PQQ synthesis protein D (PqqD)
VNRDERTPRWAPDVQMRSVGGEVVLAAAGVVFTLRDVGADVWRLADGSRSVAKIGEAITHSYDVSPETALKDVRTFVDELTDAGLLL